MFQVALTRGAVRFDVQDHEVPYPLAADHHLPVIPDSVRAAEDFLEYPWTDVAHAAHDHFVTAAPDLRNPAHRDAAFAWLVDQPRHVRRSVTDERHDVA